MSYDTQQIDAMRAKIGELSRENIGLKTMLTESENRRAGIDKCITEAAAKIVSQELEIIRLKAANAELVKLNLCAVGTHHNLSAVEK